MISRLLFAIISITLDLIFYTLGVFSERKAGILNENHVITFWLGFLFDCLGTITMGTIADGIKLHENEALIRTIHSFTGTIAIVLMLLHASFATFVLLKDDLKTKKVFHKFSIFIWLIWLAPYFVGMILGNTR